MVNDTPSITTGSIFSPPDEAFAEDFTSIEDRAAAETGIPHPKQTQNTPPKQPQPTSTEPKITQPTTAYCPHCGHKRE